jgi:hypothetical protein
VRFEVQGFKGSKVSRLSGLKPPSRFRHSLNAHIFFPEYRIAYSTVVAAATLWCTFRCGEVPQLGKGDQREPCFPPAEAGHLAVHHRGTEKNPQIAQMKKNMATANINNKEGIPLTLTLSRPGRGDRYFFKVSKYFCRVPSSGRPAGGLCPRTGRWGDQREPTSLRRQPVAVRCLNLM